MIVLFVAILVITECVFRFSSIQSPDINVNKLDDMHQKVVYTRQRCLIIWWEHALLIVPSLLDYKQEYKRQLLKIIRLRGPLGN